MKKLLVLLLVFLLVFSFTACNKNKTPTSSDTNSSSKTDDNISSDVTSDLPTFTFTQYGDAKLTIVGAEFDKDDYDEDFLRVYYDYTNTGKSAVFACPTMAVDFAKITQDGNECEDFELSYMDDCAKPEDLQNDLYVLPGYTSRQTMLIYCDPNGGEIEISCYVMIGNYMYNPDDLDLFTFKIDPKDMMGAPEAFVAPSVTTAAYAAGLPTSGTSEEPISHDVSIDGWELTKGDDGEDVLRVKFTMTNKSSDTSYPASMIQEVNAYQDALALSEFSDWDLEEVIDGDDSYGEDVEPGDTVKFNVLFLLRNDNPVEVVAEQYGDEMRLGIVCDIKAEKARLQADKDAQQQALDAATKAAMKAFIGVWDRTNSWEDHLTFNEDGTGIHDMTGDLYDFTYKLDGEKIYIYYDDGDEAEYSYTISGNDLVLKDYFDDEQTFVRAEKEDDTDASSSSEVSDSQSSEESGDEVDFGKFVIGKWVDPNTEYEETFVFNKDGTGTYSWIEGELWEYGFTYEITDNYVYIQYDDGDEGQLWLKVKDEDTLLITTYATTDMEFVRK